MGIPLLEIVGFLVYWLQNVLASCFKVHWFLGLLVVVFFVFGFWVSCSQSFKLPVSKFIGLEVSKRLVSKVSMIPCYQISISCLLIDIDLISKFFIILLDGSSLCVFRCLSFAIFSKFEIFRTLRFIRIIVLEKIIGDFLNYLR